MNCYLWKATDIIDLTYFYIFKNIRLDQIICVFMQCFKLGQKTKTSK